MHFLNTITFGVAALAASASASSLEVNNYCSQSLWLNFVNSSQGYSQTELKSGTAFLQDISGKGNSLGVTKSSDYYSSKTAKFILGTTIDNALLWWSVSNV